MPAPLRERLASGLGTVTWRSASTRDARVWAGAGNAPVAAAAAPAERRLPAMAAAAIGAVQRRERRLLDRAMRAPPLNFLEPPTRFSWGPCIDSAHRASGRDT